MYKIYQTAIVLFLSLSFASCDAQKKTNLKTTTEVQNDTLDTYFSKLYAAKMFNGAVAVKRNGKLIFKKGYGIANLEKQNPFLTTTSFRDCFGVKTIYRCSHTFATAGKQINSY